MRRPARFSGRRSRPTLAVSITSRDGAQRLPRVLAEAAMFADEILVGVDDASVDDTLDVASAGADQVYRFRHGGHPGPARLLALERTRCDWMLVLDDDEGVDAALPAVLADLLPDARQVHWAFPVRWVVSLDPCTYRRASPWYPEFVLRLFRADPSMVWKPAGIHTGIRVMGPGGREDRTAILHYEPMLLDDAGRAAKLASYRARGSDHGSEVYYAPLEAPVPTAVAPHGPLITAGARHHGPATVDPAVVDMEARPHTPAWNAELAVEMPATAPAGELFFPEVTARNTGGLAWRPPAGPDGQPMLNLAYRLYGAAGEPLEHQGERTPVGRIVDPGDTTRFLCRIRAPERAGEYVLAWEMVSELECWFGDCGAEPVRMPLRVTS